MSRLGCFLLYLFCALSSASAAEKKVLDIRDAFETTRFAVEDASGNSISLSPDGTRYAMMLIRGDIARDGVEVEIISGSLYSLASAVPKSVVRLFTRGFGATKLGQGNAVRLLVPGTNFPKWIDNERVAFLWEDDSGTHQVVAANVETNQWDYLTNAETDVTGFAAGRNRVLVYEAKKKYSLDRSNSLWNSGFTIANSEALSLLLGAADGTSIRDIAWGVGERFVLVGNFTETNARRIQVTHGGPNTYYLQWPLLQPSVSPDGRNAVVPGTPEEASEAWRRYDGAMIQATLREWRIDRRASAARNLQQMFVVSIDDATARPLWDAPLNPERLAAVRWSPDSRAILAWPVYLPIGGERKVVEVYDAVVEINARTGKYTTLPLSPNEAREIEDVQWISASHIRVRLNGKGIAFRKERGEWRKVGAVDQRDIARGSSAAKIRLEVRQNPNVPPALYAIDVRTGEDVLVLDPNPKLRTEFIMGKVTFPHWKDQSGRTWQGRLFYPVGFDPNRRYPLVIQTHAWGRREDFALYGQGSPKPNLGPGWSVYLAQPLANRGIAVLQVGPSLDGEPPFKGFPNDANMRMHVFETAIDHLSRQGTIDPTRVGIMGHSRSGWLVEHALAFSDFEYAAAIADDNIDSGYFEAGIAGWTSEERRNGADPFGVGMKLWLENSPVFNLDRFRSPLLMIMTDSYAGRAGPVVHGWELFSRLRHLKKPVEYFVIPNIERGSHTLQNPTQLLAEQERAMDWWLYWLKDERSEDLGKHEQYEAWDKLRALRDRDLQRPRPPRLRWAYEAESEICAGGACRQE